MRLVSRLSRWTLLALVAAAPLAAQAAPTAPSDLSLLDAVRLGRQQAVSATLANLDARRAGAKVGIRRADLLPQLSGAASITPQTLNLEAFGFPGTVIGVTPPFTIYQLQGRASQVIFDATAIQRLKAASDSAAVAGLDAQHAGALAGTAAGLAYLRVLAAAEVVAARVQDSAIAAQLLAQARQFQAAGVTPAIDLTRNEVNARAVQSEILTARNEEARARLDLLRILDLPLDATVHLTDSLGTPPADVPRDPATAVPFALEHRPDVAAEAGRTVVAERTVRAIKYEHLPSLGFQGTWDLSGQETDGMLYSYRLFFGMQVPIFDGTRREHRATEAEIQLEAQQLRQADRNRQAEQEVRRALLDLATAESTVELATDRLKLSEQELRQARERFDAGVAGSVETTQAQAVVVAARNALIQARATYGVARISLYQSLGVLDRLQ
ncbi:MAG TPA: TolC family protein [Gemmatimonadales bacterium]|nr:TolC family protein [Gemmatimonadales bacterium]